MSDDSHFQLYQTLLASQFVEGTSTSGGGMLSFLPGTRRVFFLGM